jgi:TetR/AcrR family transcriptional repressor of nem operon
MAAPQPAPATRGRLIAAAMELFWENGSTATGVAEILERAGVRSGSLYYFFASKEELLLAVLDRYLDLLWPEVFAPVFADERDPIRRIFATLSRYRQGLEMTGVSGGCPIGNLALELSDHHPQVRAKISANFDAWCAVVRRCLDDVGEKLPAEVNRERLSHFVLTVLEGAIMQARAQRSLKPFDDSVAQLRDYFDRLLSSPPPPSRRAAGRRRRARR